MKEHPHNKANQLCRIHVYFSQRMHDAIGTVTGSPVAVSFPDFESILKTTTLLPGMLAQSNHLPSGVMSRF